MKCTHSEVNAQESVNLYSIKWNIVSSFKQRFFLEFFFIHLKGKNLKTTRKYPEFCEFKLSGQKKSGFSSLNYNEVKYSLNVYFS